MKFKKGYTIVVDSWENDGDLPIQRIFSGLTKEQVLFYSDLCDILKCTYTYYDNNNHGCFGNMYEPNMKEIDEFYNEVEKIYKKHNVVFNEDEIFEIIHELTGCSDEFYTRIVENFQIYNVEEEIEFKTINIKDLK